MSHQKAQPRPSTLNLQLVYMSHRSISLSKSHDIPLNNMVPYITPKFYMIPYITPLRESRLWLICSERLYCVFLLFV